MLDALGKLAPLQIAYVIMLVFLAGVVIVGVLEGKLGVRELAVLVAGSVGLGVLVFAL
jgi:hypothetical protein